MRGKEDRFDRAVEEIDLLMIQEDLRVYSKTVVEEFRNPSNVGRMADADGEAMFTGPCGDTMEMYVKQREGRISECKFFTDGCGATIACGSMATKLVTGLTLSEATELTPERLIESLEGLPEDHAHCAKLAVKTLRMAIDDCLRRMGGPVDRTGDIEDRRSKRMTESDGP